MPRLVVPILRRRRSRASRAASSSPCSGRISGGVFGDRRLSGVISTPWLASLLDLVRRDAQGSTTTPLPITDSLPLRTMPDGSSASLYVLPSMTSVWPALWPPWKRTTTSAPTDSQSTILPLPSSPHWAPITATFDIIPYPDRLPPARRFLPGKVSDYSGMSGERQADFAPQGKNIAPCGNRNRRHRALAETATTRNRLLFRNALQRHALRMA